MSMVTATQTQRRDKSANVPQKQLQATAEQLRLAQIIDGNTRDEDTEMHRNVEKIMEVTGTSEDNARTALYDTNNDTNRAIELILENGSCEQGSEWETAGRRKHKNSQNVSKTFDSLDDDIKDTPQQSGGRRDRIESKGRGRGRNNKNRGKNDDREKSTEDDGRGGYESRERQRGGRRGRGRGGSYSNRGRQPGRGPRRFGRLNRDKSENAENGRNSDGTQQKDLNDGFGTYTNKNSDAVNSSDPWAGDDENWDSLKVGTWSNDDTKRRNGKKHDSISEAWGTDTWADDLTETKVFQSQTAQPTGPSGMPSSHGSIPQQAVSKPQMGERIDIDTLFKKTQDSNAGYGQQLGSSISQSGLPYSSGPGQHNTASVIQQLQQQGQSNSLFSDNKPAGNEMEPSSRLFGSYDRQASGSSTNAVAPIGHYTSVQGHNNETPYSQFNGKLATENSERSSSLLGSFGAQFKATEKTGTSGMLGPMSDLTKSAFTTLKPGVTKNVPPPPGIGSDYNSFSQTKQQEATDAVKASLGLSSTGDDQLESVTSHTGLSSLTHTQSMSHGTLSFGEPLSIRQPKQQRRKQLSKIPAAAVEMPGAGGGNYHEMSNFDLQFGIDDGSLSSTPGDFSNANGALAKSAAGVAPSSSLFSTGGGVSTPVMLMDHMSSGTSGDSSMFPKLMPGQQTEARTIQRSSYQSLQQTEFSKAGNQLGATKDSLSHSNQQAGDSTSVSLHGTQRFPDGKKPSEGPRRGPPGLTHPLASAANVSASNLAPISGTNKQADLSSSGSYTSGRIMGGGNLPLSGLSPESSMDQASVGNPPHSYYTSTSLGQQSQQQQQQLGSDVPNSAGRSLRSPVPTTSLQGSLQGSPMSHISAAPPKDGLSGSASTAMSSLTSGLSQTHITPNVGSTPTKMSAPTASAPLNIPGSSASSSSQIGGSNTYGSMTMHLPYSASPSPAATSQVSVAPAASSPNKHMSNDLYPSSLHHNHPQQSSAAVSSVIGSSLGSSVLSSAAGTPKTSASVSTATTKAGPPNLPLGVPPMLPNQFGIPVAPGLMTAYPEAALYGYTDLSQMAVQSRMVNQMPNYYDVSSFHNTANPSASASNVNRETSSSSVNQGKFSHREPSSPTSVIGMMNASVGSGLAQQVAGQHNAQLKAVSQTGTHQAQPFMNLPTAHAAYPGYSGLYYNAFQYPPMFAAAAAAAASAVPQSGKHSASATTAFQQHGTGFANAYSPASVNASTASTLQDLQGQGYTKSHASAYDKQQAAFHHHTNTPPPAFSLQTLTAAMAAANTGGAGAGAAAPGMSPYTQAPFMTMLPHQHSQIHLHVPQHGDVGQSVSSQRSQTNAMGKSAAKPAFNSAQFWPN